MKILSVLIEYRLSSLSTPFSYVCNDEEKIRSVLRKDYSYDIYEIALKELKKEEKKGWQIVIFML